jgi:tetratricopeptide (TPR) repeat protein
MVGLGQIALDFIGWGTDFLDYDNDGRLDLFVVNGSTFQKESDPSTLLPMRNQIFWNAGKPKGFFEVGEGSGDSFKVENVGRGAAVADYDQDGDLDIAVAVNGGEARLLRNDGGNRNSWTRVILRGAARRPSGRAGAGPATSTFATGALVRLRSGGTTQVRMVGGSSSYLSQSPPGEVWFGLGEEEAIQELEVIWPDGSRQLFTDLPVRRMLRLAEGGEIQADPPVQAGVRISGAATPSLSRDAVLRFWELFNEAGRLRREKDYGAAAEKYRAALALQGRHEDSLYYLGQCLRETGDFGGAARAWKDLVSVNPASARGHLALGALHSSPDERAPMNLGVAENHFRRAHAINGEETGPMLRLGEVLVAAGRLPEAQHWLESAARTNPKSVEAACMAGYVSWKKGDVKGAAEFYQKASRAAKTDVPVKGVLSEGDRKATAPPGGGKAAAPPLKEPMGKTLFGALCDALRTQDPSGVSTRPPTKDSLDRLYKPIQDFTVRLARLSGAGLSGRAANTIPGTPGPETDRP